MKNSYHGTKILEFPHFKVADKRDKSPKLESIQQSKWKQFGKTRYSLMIVYTNNIDIFLSM